MKKTLLAIIIALLMAVPAFAVGPPGSGSGSGVQTASDCDVAAYYAIGTLCQDTDDGKLYKGTGAAVVEIAAGASGDVVAADTAHTWGDGTGPQVWTFSVTGTDPTITVTAAAFTLNTSLALGANNLTMTGSLGATGAGKLTKVWAVDGEFTNYPTVNGGVVFNQAVTSTSNPAFSTANLTGANSLGLGSNSGGLVGSIIFKNGANGNYFTMTSGATGAAIGWTLPTAAPGGANYLLNADADGTMGYTDPAAFQPAGAKLTSIQALASAAGYLKNDGAGTFSYDSPAGGGDVSKVGTPSNHQWAFWTGNGTLAGVSITASKPVCSDASGDPVVCAGTEGVWSATGHTHAVPTVITVADEAADASSFPLFVTAATGDLGPKTDTAFTYDPTTGTVGATKFAGAFNGTIGATTPAAGTFTGITVGAGGITTAASASPTNTYLDSDALGADKEIAKIVGGYVDGADGSENGTMDLFVHEAGTTTSYIQADGKNVRVDLLKPVYAASTVTVGGQLNLMTTDADPATTAGGIKHDSSSTESQTTARGVLKWFDGTSVRTIADVGTDSTIITKTEFLPIRYAEDGSAAPAAAAAVTGKNVIARSFADGKDVVFFWSVPADYVGAGDVKYRVHYALADNASADDTVTFTMTGCAIANSADIACSAGTGLAISDELGTDDDQYQYMVTDYSAASNADWGIAAGGFAKLGFSYSDGDYDAAALVIGIEIKYKAKLVGLAGY